MGRGRAALWRQWGWRGDRDWADVRRQGGDPGLEGVAYRIPGRARGDREPGRRGEPGGWRDRLDGYEPGQPEWDAPNQQAGPGAGGRGGDRGRRQDRAGAALHR